MKILEVATDAPPYKGGVARLVGILSKGLQSRGHQICILTPRFRIKEFKLSNIPFYRYDCYDIIHIHGPTPFLSDMSLLLHQGGPPIVYTHHAEISWLSERLSLCYRRLHRLLAERIASTIIVHSYDYASLFKGNNVRVIRMPSPLKPPDVDPLESKPREPFTVVYVGQLRPFKGVDSLLRVAHFLTDVRFVIVGDGWLKPKLLSLADGLKNVEFLGQVSDDKLRDIYLSSHVVALPSTNTTEAWGLTLLEGALHGCLPMASSLIGVRENISLLGGISFTTILEFAEKLRFLASHRREWDKMAAKSQRLARNYASKYTPQYYIDVHEAIFKTLIP